MLKSTVQMMTLNLKPVYYFHQETLAIKMEGFPKEKSVCIFESIGGFDKGQDGYRFDTLPIFECIKKEGWHCEIVKFQNDKAEEIYQYVKAKFCGYIPRISPGTLPDKDKIFLDIMRKLSLDGLIGLTHPDSMSNYGSKEILTKLKKTGLVIEETEAYYDVDHFKRSFPKSLSYGERVLKQNEGLYGIGTWRVTVEDERLFKVGDCLPFDTKIKCTEAINNYVEHYKLGDFMEFCEKYICCDNGLLINMQFLPRIREGQIRIVLVGDHPFFVVHKKPAQITDAFSTELKSGAQYRYDEPKEWPTLMSFFADKLPLLKVALEEQQPPLIWTADFIMDNNKDKSDRYVLSEINPICITVTTHIDQNIQEAIAKEVVRQASAYKTKIEG